MMHFTLQFTQLPLIEGLYTCHSYIYIFKIYILGFFLVIHFVIVVVSGEVWGSELHHGLCSVLHTDTGVHTHVFIQNHVEDYKFGENSEVSGKSPHIYYVLIYN